MGNELYLDSVITRLLILINLYFSWKYFSLPQNIQATWRLFPYQVIRGYNKSSIVLSMFIHSTWLHFAVNMFVLNEFGSIIETVLGQFHFVMMYFLSGFIASFALIYKYAKIPNYSALGASGATSGIVYGFIMLEPNQDLYLLFIPIPIKAYLIGILYLVYSYYQSRKGHGRIAHEAHIAGALMGVGYIVLLNFGVFI